MRVLSLQPHHICGAQRTLQPATWTVQRDRPYLTRTAPTSLLKTMFIQPKTAKNQSSGVSLLQHSCLQRNSWIKIPYGRLVRAAERYGKNSICDLRFTRSWVGPADCRYEISGSASRARTRTTRLRQTSARHGTRRMPKIRMPLQSGQNLLESRGEIDRPDLPDAAGQSLENSQQ